MRVVINQAQIDRNRKISHILFFVSLAGMGIGFFYTWTNPAESSQISCLLLPTLLMMTIVSVRMANTWIREPRPIDVLEESLKGLGKRYVLFHHLLPAPNVLIGPEGVFTLTTVWQEGDFGVKGKKWYGDGGIARRIAGYMRQDLLGDPFRDALFHAQQIQRLVNKVAPDEEIEVQPVVVFIHPNVNVEIEDPTLPVVFADSKKKPSLRNFLRDQKSAERPSLSEEHLDIIDQAYGLVTRQEIARMLGETSAEADIELDYAEADEDEIAEVAASEAPEDDATEAAEITEEGTIYVIQKENLYKLGVTAVGSADRVLAEIQNEENSPVVLYHTIDTEEPQAMLAYLEQKFARKKQKDWYGLSKKDAEWLQALEGKIN
jgi:hypothetical protein